MTTTATQSKRLNLSEVKDGVPAITATDLFAEAQVDEGTGVIANVTLLSATSANGRRYTPQALDDAVRLYDGVQYYMDHPTERELRERAGNRDVKDLLGRIRNPRRAGAMVRGDIEVLEGAAHRSLLFSIARQMPETAGNSHRATGAATVDEDGTQVVESLESVEAIELVTNPATTHGLFESEDITGNPEDEDEAMKIEELTLETLRESRGDLVEAITAEAKASTDAEKLEAKIKALKEANDTLEAKLAAKERAELVDDKLSEADLPEYLVTEAFTGQLKAAKDEDAIDALLADRTAIAENATKRNAKPVSHARDLDEALDEEDEHEPLTEEATAAAYDKLFG